MHPIISPAELLKTLPCSEEQRDFIYLARNSVRDIASGKDSRMMMVVGPCSIHNPEEALEYAVRLKQLSREIEDQIYLVMRVYVEKPRTTVGWKGLLHDPHLDGRYDINLGLHLSRKLLLDIADLELPTATEFLDPISPSFLGDLISWGSVGARTAASQTHRQMASGLSMPVGVKNNTEGDVEVAIHGVLAAQAPHSYIGFSEDARAALVRSQGNPDCHVVLRGGRRGSNIHPQQIENTVQSLEKWGLPSRFMVDCSHDNCGKDHRRQVLSFNALLGHILDGRREVFGLLVESNLYEGRQSMDEPDKLRYGVSVTDPCLDWESTRRLLTWACEELRMANEPRRALAGMV